MTRFLVFTDEELDAMEPAFCDCGLISLVDEIRIARKMHLETRAMLEPLIDDLRAGEITHNKAREKLNLLPIESDGEK